MNFPAYRCAGQCCDARYQIAIGAILTHVTARYVPLVIRGVFSGRFVCASVRAGVRGWSGVSHDDSLKPRVYYLTCTYDVGTCTFDKGSTVACSD